MSDGVDMIDIDNFYDQTEVHTNVSVQILYNSHTGKSSIAWSDNPVIINRWKGETDNFTEHDPVFID